MGLIKQIPGVLSAPRGFDSWFPSPRRGVRGEALFFVAPDFPGIFLGQCLTAIYCDFAVNIQALCQHADSLSLFCLQGG